MNFIADKLFSIIYNTIKSWTIFLHDQIFCRSPSISGLILNIHHQMKNSNR